ncbi:EamA family transporter [Klebsiella michiganensis]|nr:EamA family transporter [Klebsiella michiganensis]
MLPARKSESLLLLVTLCAGAGWIFSKEALGALPPVFFIAVRFLAGGLLLGLAVPAADRREWRRSLWHSLRHRQPDLRLDDVLDCGAASYHRAGRWRLSHLPRAAVGAVRRMAAVPPGAVEAHRARHAARPTRHCAVGGQQLSPVAVRGGPVLVFWCGGDFRLLLQPE